MATTTTNNAWAIPQSTDLVTNGATAMATLGQAIDTSVGTGLKAWTAYTPTVTNVTKGTGPTESYTYCQLGKTVTVRIKLTLGTGGSVSGSPTFTLPVTATSTGVSMLGTGVGSANDASPVATYVALPVLASTTTVFMYLLNTASTYGTLTAVSSTVPMTWTTSDNLTMMFTYEAA